MTDRRPPLMYLVDVLEALGLQFGLDYDGELQVTYPLLAPTQADLAKIIEQQRPHLVQALETRRIATLKVFVGGPLNGRRHRQYVAIEHWIFPVRISYAKWAVYQGTATPWADPRLHFLGYAKSRAKARRGLLLPKSREGRS